MQYHALYAFAFSMLQTQLSNSLTENTSITSSDINKLLSHIILLCNHLLDKTFVFQPWSAARFYNIMLVILNEAIWSNKVTQYH